MFLTRKIDKATVAVLDDFPVSIALRPSGREYYGKEEIVCKVTDGKLIINKETAARYGLEVEIQ